jgi:predicted DCC family thiol-disulfide oxidoreductase YuxK|mmetsp:Transcript_1758/g.1905  ORF Transcript_1758/g.1905 Transcript_1758/m.1905 type:complete len:196 (+) Transcript_1758:90-677(+)
MALNLLKKSLLNRQIINIYRILMVLSSVMILRSLGSKSRQITRSTSTNFDKLQAANSSDELSNIVLFDGMCNFCNKWVDILLTLDTDKKVKFCPAQSAKGKEYLTKIGRNADELSTVVLIKSFKGHQNVYLKSDAVLKVMAQLGFFWYLFSSINLILPSFLRNGVYDIVARNRYSILGKRAECRCGDINYSDRFI